MPAPGKREQISDIEIALEGKILAVDEIVPVENIVVIDRKRGLLREKTGKRTR